jgi:hypothetical protein
MIEYTLISSILDKICEMTTKPCNCPRYDILVTPLLTFAWNQNMGNIMEKNNWQNRWMGNLVMGECEHKQRKSCNIETNCKHFERRY